MKIAIAAPLDFVLNYCDKAGIVTQRVVTLLSVETFPGEIYLNARCHSANAMRSFIGRRIAAIARPDTGEVVDAASFIAALTNQPAAELRPLFEKRERRRRFCETDFTETVAGWAFGVHSAFRPALDILWHRKSRQWTRGDPPAYDFAVGDVFHATAPPRIAQIQSAEPDIAHPDGIDDGWLTFRLWEGEPGSVTCRDIECSQAEFVGFLRTGIQPSLP